MMSKRKPSVPHSALHDGRLSSRDLRVLAALSLFEQKRGSEISPDRSSIASITGSHETNVSHSLTRLAKFGYLKLSLDGRQRSVRIHWSEGDDQQGQLVSNSTLQQCQIQHSNGVKFDTPTVSDSTPINGVGVEFNTQHGGKSVEFDTQPDICPIGTRAHTRSSVVLDIKNTDQIRSDQTRGIGITGIGDVIEILVRFGMPERFVRNAEARALMGSWVGKYSAEQITSACERSAKALEGNGVIGPKYVNRALETAGGVDGKGGGAAAPRRLSAAEQAHEDDMRAAG